MNRQLVIALLLAAAAAGLAYYYLQEREADLAARVTPVKVLIAKGPIPRGAALTADKVAIVEMPAAYLMPGAVSAPEREGIVKAWEQYRDQFAVVPIAKGEQILPNKLTRILPGFAGSVPEGFRIVAFAFPPAAAVGGHLKPGNRVDVLGTFDHQYRGAKRITTVMLAQNVLVTAVGAQTTSSEPGQNSASATTGGGDLTVSFALTPTDVTRLCLAEAEGRLILALRAQDDENRLDLPDQNLGTVLGPLMRVQHGDIKSAPKRIEIIKGF